jgi:phage baseplate assembly protein W
MGDTPKLTGAQIEAGRIGHYEAPEASGLGVEIEWQLFPVIHSLFLNTNPILPRTFSRGRSSRISTHTAHTFNRGTASLITSKGAPIFEGAQIEAGRIGHYEAPEAEGLGVEIEWQLFPVIHSLFMNLNPIYPRMFSRGSPSEVIIYAPVMCGIEIGVADEAELTGIEVYINPELDLIHPTWLGDAGIDAVTTESNFAISFTLKSSGSDNYANNRYEVFIKEGIIGYAELFQPANTLGAFKHGEQYISALPDGSNPQPSTQYTLGVKLIDSLGNSEDSELVVNFSTSSGGTLLDAPVLEVTDDGTGTTATVELKGVTSDPDYVNVEVYRLQEETTTHPAYKQLLGTLVSLGDTISVTGLSEGEELKIVGCCIDTNGVRGYASRINSLIIEISDLAEEDEPALAAQYPFIDGDVIGKGTKYPFTIEDGSVVESTGIDRLREIIVYIMRTEVGTRIAHRDFGVDLITMPFDIMRGEIAPLVFTIVKESVEALEPRVRIDNVTVVGRKNDNTQIVFLVEWSDTQDGGTDSFKIDLNASGGE